MSRMTRTIPAPGKIGGPCEEVCGHPACQEMFQTAGTPCLRCGRPISFEIEFEELSFRQYQHVVCPEYKPLEHTTDATVPEVVYA